MSKVYTIPYYPVGSILEFDRAMDMKSIYGGTWELYGTGRMTVGINSNDVDFKTAGKTGGNKMCTQTVAEMPAHSHGIAGVNSGAAIIPTAGNYPVAIAQDQKHNWMVPSELMYAAGESKPMDIMNPYITVYRYRKVAE